MRFNNDATALLDSQLGAITRRQLIDAGYTASQVDAMIRRGHVEAVEHGVYRRTGSGHTPQQDAVVALLRCGPGARLTGPRLLGCLGIEGFAIDDPFTVLVAGGRRIQQRSYELRPDHRPDLHTASYGAISGTTPARTLAELAADERSDEDLLRTYDRMRWRGAVNRQRLASTVDELPRHRGAARLQRLLATTSAIVESPAERRLEADLADLQPPLEWQVWVAPDLRVDALWRDVALVLEYQGAGHDDPRERERDGTRHARLRAMGYEVVVIDRYDLRDVAALRSRLLAARRLRAAALTAG